MSLSTLQAVGGTEISRLALISEHTTDSAQARRRELLRAARMATPYRTAVGLITALTVGLAALNSFEPLVIKYIFDEIPGRGLRALAFGVFTLAAIGVGRELANAGSNWLIWRTRLALQYDLLELVVERLHRMPLRMHREEGVGAVLTRLDRSIQGFIGAVTQLLFEIFPALLYLFLSLYIMLRLDWRLALIAAAFIPIPPMIATLAAPEQIRRERTLLDRWARIYSRFNEVLSGLVTVRSFAMEDAEKERFLGGVREANRVVVRGVAIDTGFGAAANSVVAIARVVVIGLGSLYVIGGDMTLGTLAAFMGYLGGLFAPVQGLAGLLQTFHRASVSIRQIFSILDMQEHLGDAPDAITIERPRGAVRFDGVRFRYEGMTQPLLDGITLDVDAGRSLAIVGPSGSGKSTLMALLMRFYDPDEGTVSIDGHDVRRVAQASLRRNIGVVLQEPLLFNDTVRANIAYGDPTAGYDAIEAAARAAHAHDFIGRLPDGYDTNVGERGSFLSVGERQRIAIARALLKNPAIVILDEPTSSLDAETETLIRDALDTLLEGRTCFIIAHRLITVVHADAIAVMRNGRIVQSGTHRELMEVDGYYRDLVRRQTHGLLPSDPNESGTARPPSDTFPVREG